MPVLSEERYYQCSWKVFDILSKSWMVEMLLMLMESQLLLACQLTQWPCFHSVVLNAASQPCPVKNLLKMSTVFLLFSCPVMIQDLRPISLQRVGNYIQPMQDESVTKFWCQRNNEQPYIQYTVDPSFPDSLEGETIDFTECPYTTPRLLSLLVILIFGRVGHDTSWCDEWWYTPRLIQEIIYTNVQDSATWGVCMFLHTPHPVHCHTCFRHKLSKRSKQNSCDKGSTLYFNSTPRTHIQSMMYTW